MGLARTTLYLSCALSFLSLAAGQYGYSGDPDYYDQYELYDAGYHYDLTDEEASDSGMYFNQYSGSYDDAYGDYFEDPIMEAADCRIAENGKAKINGTVPACDLKLEGADKVLKGMAGGLDGLYEVNSCESGLPTYKRKDSKPNEGRVLWYSSEFRDWDVTNGSLPQSEDVLMYGGDGAREARPNFVSAGWKVAAEFVKDYTGTEEYVPIKFALACADGSKIEKPEAKPYGSVPLFNDDEAQAQYSHVIKKGVARKNSSAEVNLGLVTLLVMIGLGIVFGLPYLVARNRRRRRAGSTGGDRSGGLASILDLSSKRGHTN